MFSMSLVVMQSRYGCCHQLDYCLVTWSVQWLLKLNNTASINFTTRFCWWDNARNVWDPTLGHGFFGQCVSISYMFCIVTKSLCVCGHNSTEIKDSLEHVLSHHRRVPKSDHKRLFTAEAKKSSCLSYIIILFAEIIVSIRTYSDHNLLY